MNNRSLSQSEIRCLMCVLLLLCVGGEHKLCWFEWHFSFWSDILLLLLVPLGVFSLVQRRLVHCVTSNDNIHIEALIALIQLICACCFHTGVSGWQWQLVIYGPCLIILLERGEGMLDNCCRCLDDDDHAMTATISASSTAITTTQEIFPYDQRMNLGIEKQSTNVTPVVTGTRQLNWISFFNVHIWP